MRTDSSIEATTTPVVRTVALEEPVDLVAGLADPGGYLWARGDRGLVGWGEAARVAVGTGPRRFDDAVDKLTDVFASFDVEDEVQAPGTGPVAFGSFTFDDASPGSVLVVPEVVIGRAGQRAWMTVTGGGAQSPLLPRSVAADHDHERIRYAGSTMSEVAWLEAVATAVDSIARGHIEKVVLARDLLVWSKVPFDARTLAYRLAAAFPECHTFTCKGLVGATPELLVGRAGNNVTSLVLGGSARRGATPEGDALLGSELRASSKDRHEHDLAVASVRARLEPLCHRLEIDPEPWLLRLSNVQHLATGVTGELATSYSSLRLAGVLHPTAAVCGTPPEAARKAIDTLEGGLDRGRYAGPVGWVDARGDGEWGIALRCAELNGDRARLFAGAGIVDGSVPEEELEETRLKLRAMQGALEASGT